MLSGVCGGGSALSKAFKENGRWGSSWAFLRREWGFVGSDS
jgi:hypothetical protein